MDDEKLKRLEQDARKWLSGYYEGHNHIRVEDGTAADKQGRYALSELLMLATPPRALLDSLATLFAPDEPKTQPLRGIDLQRPIGAQGQPLLLGNVFRLTLPKRRKNTRMNDQRLVGTILHRIRDKREAGLSLERAYAELEEELISEGYDGLSARSLKKIWDDHKSWREAVWG